METLWTVAGLNWAESSDLEFGCPLAVLDYVKLDLCDLWHLIDFETLETNKSQIVKCSRNA